jgi:hypothetical protein
VSSAIARMSALPQFTTRIDDLAIHLLHARSPEPDAMSGARARGRWWSEPARGGHFAAFEQPAIFVDEVRSAFRVLRAQQASAAGKSDR